MPQSPPISIVINNPTTSPVDLSVKRSAIHTIRIPPDQSGPINKFITIVGSPPPPSESRPPSNHPAILPSPNPHETVDVLDAMDEDPFTLESFESMINLHAEKNIDFIIARVQTVDPADEKRFYYSYYAAHHINKVLFRTQPEEGLLHRMRAKNPLNNMTIIGDVHYYVIKPQKLPSPAKAAPPKSPLEHFVKMVLTTDTPSTKRAKSIKSNFSSSSGSKSIISHIFGLESKPEPLHFMIKQEAYENDVEFSDRMTKTKKRNSFDDAYSDISPSLRPSTNSKAKKMPEQNHRHRNVRSIAYSNERTNSMTIEEWIKMKNLPSPDDIVMSASTRVMIEENSPRKRKTSPASNLSFPEKSKFKRNDQNENIFYVAQYYASDDDFLMHASIRAYFTANAFEDQDHVLFTIQPQSENAGEVHPTLANLSLFLGNPQTRAQTRLRQNLKWLILIYFICAVLIVKYAVSARYKVLAGFLSFFFFTLILVISL